MKSVIMTLAAAFAVSAYANAEHKAATKPAAGHEAAPAPGKPTATAPATTHGDDHCKAAKDPKKCMEEQKKKSM